MRTRVIFFMLALIIWMLLNLPLNVQNIMAGILVSLLATLFVGDFFTQRPHKFFHPLRYFWFLVYIPLFVWECLKANIDVAFRVIHPRRPINPGIVKVKTSLHSDTALTFLANSITLTPGTLTVDVDKENGILYVHWINVKSQDIETATRHIVERFEKILRRIFE